MAVHACARLFMGIAGGRFLSSFVTDVARGFELDYRLEAISYPAYYRPCRMPIRLIIKNDHAFSPDEAKRLVEAFEDTLRALKLVDREDPVTMLVAKRIIELAKQGERDPVQLRERTLKTIQGD